MKVENSIYELVGNSTQILSERDEDDVERQFIKSEIMYPILSLIETVNTQDFEITWQTMKNEILTLDPEYKTIFIQLMIEKIEKEYQIEFIPKIDPSTYVMDFHFNLFLDLIEFIEIKAFDMISYIIFVNNFDENEFLNRLTKKMFIKINFGINRYINNYIINPLIRDFLNNTNSEIMINWLTKLYFRYVSEIHSKTAERRIRYEQDND